MATTTTDRLALKMQAAGDNPGTWEVDLNQGFVDADARFFLADAGDPNAEIHGDESDAGMESVYIGQRYHDTDTDIWWTAQDIGAPGTWVSDQAILMAGMGMCTGRLVWGSETTIVLTRAYGTILYAEIDGVIVSLADDLTFDMEADIFEGGEGPSEPIYLYVQNDAGVLTPQLSGVAPDDLGGTKPGYSPNEAAYRCIGSWWNDSSGDLMKGQYDRDGWLRFNSSEGTDHIYNEVGELTLTGQADWRALSLNLPKTVSNIQLHITGYAGADAYMALAVSAAATGIDLPTSSVGPPWKYTNAKFIDAVIIVQIDNRGVMGATNAIMPISDRTAPALKYGHNTNADPTFMEFVVKGYQDIWAPKGY